MQQPQASPSGQIAMMSVDQLRGLQVRCCGALPCSTVTHHNGQQHTKQTRYETPNVLLSPSLRTLI